MFTFLIKKIKDVLRYTEFDQISIDDPQTTILRRSLILKNSFLLKIYTEWYSLILTHIQRQDHNYVLELGSGAGFLKKFVPHAITSDILSIPDISLVADATKLPFSTGVLDAIVMCNVLHHISNPPVFLHEARRCLNSGGVIVMIEPWNNWWSRFLHKHLHHEEFNPDGSWFPALGGPLSGANAAIPWIIFSRDRSFFLENFGFSIVEIKNIMPITYLISGGVSMKAIAPSWVYSPLRMIERIFEIFDFGIFSLIVLKKND
jgi:SAM-dependent methyltransferase